MKEQNQPPKQTSQKSKASWVKEFDERWHKALQAQALQYWIDKNQKPPEWTNLSEAWEEYQALQQKIKCI